MDMIFIAGEAINLCPPEEEDFDQWAAWFNCKETTRYLEQGKYPNTVALQKEFYKSALALGRLLLMIKTKSRKLLGVISLSEIDYEKSRCQIAIVCPGKSREAPLAALEAMALVTDHAFQRLGLSRVWAGQAYPGLKNWTKHLEIIGYKAEGFQRAGFRHGAHESDGILIAITKLDYLRLASSRGNTLWPGESIARRVLSQLKNIPSLAETLYEDINGRYAEFDLRLEGIEKEMPGAN